MTPWIVGIVVFLGLFAFFGWLWAQNHPEEAPGPEYPHDEADADGYPPGSRPAGPGAETQRPDGRPSGGDGYPIP